MNLTAFLKLKKPIKNEKYNIDLFNENADTIDTNIKKLKDESATKSELNTHIDNKNNPHALTKAHVNLGNVTNDTQVKGLSSGTTPNHVVIWGANGYAIKDSGFTIEKSVPANAKFTDTTYTLEEGVSDGTVLFNNAPVNIHGLKGGAFHDYIEINDEQPTFSSTSTLVPLSSGERITESMGKLAKVVSSVIEDQEHVETNEITIAGKVKLLFNTTTNSLDISFI